MNSSLKVVTHKTLKVKEIYHCIQIYHWKFLRIIIFLKPICSFIVCSTSSLALRTMWITLYSEESVKTDHVSPFTSDLPVDACIIFASYFSIVLLTTKLLSPYERQVISFISSSHITNWRSSHCHFSSSGSRVCNELHLSEDAKCLLVWTLILFRKYLLWFFYIFKPLLTVLETIVSRYLCVLGISVLFLLPRVLFCARRTYDMLNLTQKLLHKMDLANLVSLLYIKYFKKTKTHWSNSQL